MRAWPGEVIAAVTMPFVVLWWMLLERVIDVLNRREARRSRQVEVRPPRRAGQAVHGALRAVLDALGGHAGLRGRRRRPVAQGRCRSSAPLQQVWTHPIERLPGPGHAQEPCSRRELRNSLTA
jgi:hypothetical protein